MNWGNKLLTVFVLFGAMICFMVYRCMQTPVNLVSGQYYKDELAYQTVIDGKRHADALSGRLMLAQTEGMISITFPSEMKGRSLKGTIFFYCPNDASRDRSIPLETDGSKQQEIDRGAVPNGHYTVKVSWQSGGVGYFMEQPFVIQ